MPDEVALWSRARSGDGRAFAALFDTHRDRVYRHVLRLVPTASDAEDVVAGVFLELWRKRDAVAVVDGSVLPWALVTATNVARNTHRGLRRHRAAIDRLPRAEHLVDPAESAEERVERERLLAAVHALGTADAGLLLLVALEGYGVAEAGAALGLSPGAARVRLHRARKRLQARLTDPLPVLQEGDAR
ncbi:RNA polymerase sigma factor [Amnibacterium endophyticum]|uniref:RNA polymerase sigma factor n=1 Tax=Amnibacterium endophyticum TaxID=2109337 RepID=A0ABW4LEH5_9MICO